MKKMMVVFMMVMTLGCTGCNRIQNLVEVNVCKEVEKETTNVTSRVIKTTAKEIRTEAVINNRKKLVERKRLFAKSSNETLEIIRYETNRGNVLRENIETENIIF